MNVLFAILGIIVAAAVLYIAFILHTIYLAIKYDSDRQNF